MTPTDQAALATAVFLKVLQENPTRLQHGAKLRAEMLDAIKLGKQPGGYRPEWIKDVASIIIKMLTQAARDFDIKHCDDKASLDDLLDILRSVTRHYEKRNGDK